MKIRTDYFLRLVLIELGIGFIIGLFNNYYGAFFLFGGALMGFLYEWFGLVRKQPQTKTEKKK